MPIMEILICLMSSNVYMAEYCIYDLGMILLNVMVRSSTRTYSSLVVIVFSQFENEKRSYTTQNRKVMT